MVRLLQRTALPVPGGRFDLFEWAVTDKQIPQEKRDCILGLLLGYSVSAVSAYEAEAPVRHYAISGWAP